jgi:acetoin utilization deacetylase AcuC-like enzyme
MSFEKHPGAKVSGCFFLLAWMSMLDVASKIVATMLQAFYTDQFVLPLPQTHRFPMRKYSLLREALTLAGVVDCGNFHVPQPVTLEQLNLAHEAEYVRRAVTGELTRSEILRIGFPWSPQLIERSRRSSGATYEAGKVALQSGFSANLAGGTHHAQWDCGEGYCVFNDSIVAARSLQQDGLIRRAVIVDTDVHQGNGTAQIARGDDSIFTFSMHGAKNFPLRKEISDLDIALADGTTDGEFLDELETGLKQSIDAARPDIIVYLAGADPFLDDTLGRLKLTKSGLAARDRVVYQTAIAKGLPVVVSMAGGYARNVLDTVEIHFQSIAQGAEMLLGCPQKTFPDSLNLTSATLSR